MKTASEIARSFSLKKQGREYRGDCPVCQARKAELSVWEEPGGFGFYCYYGSCDRKDLFRLLSGASYIIPRIAPKSKQTEADTLEYIHKILAGSVPIAGTAGESYFRQRGITIPLPGSIRFMSGLWHSPSTQKHDAIVSEIADVHGQVIAVTRIWITSAGVKIPFEPCKMTLGRFKGGAIQLAKPTESLALCEGLETALSVQQMMEIPTWTAVSAGNLPGVILPESVKTVYLMADHDPAGLKAAKEAAEVYSKQGRKVILAYPPQPGWDYNDLLRAENEGISA